MSASLTPDVDAQKERGTSATLTLWAERAKDIDHEEGTALPQLQRPLPASASCKVSLGRAK